MVLTQASKMSRTDEVHRITENVYKVSFTIIVLGCGSLILFYIIYFFYINYILCILCQIYSFMV